VMLVGTCCALALVTSTPALAATAADDPVPDFYLVAEDLKTRVGKLVAYDSDVEAFASREVGNRIEWAIAPDGNLAVAYYDVESLSHKVQVLGPRLRALSAPTPIPAGPDQVQVLGAGSLRFMNASTLLVKATTIERTALPPFTETYVSFVSFSVPAVPDGQAELASDVHPPCYDVPTTAELVGTQGTGTVYCLQDEKLYQLVLGGSCVPITLPVSVSSRLTARRLTGNDPGHDGASLLIVSDRSEFVRLDLAAMSVDSYTEGDLGEYTITTFNPFDMIDDEAPFSGLVMRVVDGERRTYLGLQDDGGGNLSKVYGYGSQATEVTEYDVALDPALFTVTRGGELIGARGELTGMARVEAGSEAEIDLGLVAVLGFVTAP